MKTKLLAAMLSILCAVSAGCEKSPPPEEVEEPRPIKIEKQILFFDTFTGRLTDRTSITGGNGDYRIIYPKTLEIWGTVVNWSEEIMKVTLKEGNTIVAERTYPGTRSVSGCFLLTDARKARKVFYVTDLVLGMVDMEMMEENLLNDPNYWQE
jgi:hypothetical protein